jgi:uncharacterized protein
MKRLPLAVLMALSGATAAVAQNPIVLTPPGLGNTAAPSSPPPAAIAPASPPPTVVAPDASIVPLPRPRPERDDAAAVTDLPVMPTPDAMSPLPTDAFNSEPLPDPGNLTRGETPMLPSAAAEPESDAKLNEIAPPPPSADGPDLAYGAFQRGFYLTAFDLAIQRAEAGDVAAQTLIGLIYEGGYGVPQSYSDAFTWYQLAANSHDREAQFALGMMYLQGRGVDQDRAKAADLFEMSAKQGQIDAMYNLALLYLEGAVRPVDPKLAAQYLEQAAESGNADAQYALAQLYTQGLGVEADDSLATRWLASASRLGVVAAQVEYAIHLFNGKGVAKDETAAAQWFERAANAGDPIAQNRLARILAIGAGEPADAVDAAKWHFLAREAGKSDAWLDAFVDGLTSEQKQAAVAAAQRWPAN